MTFTSAQFIREVAVSAMQNSCHALRSISDLGIWLCSLQDSMVLTGERKREREGEREREKERERGRGGRERERNRERKK